MGTNGTAKSGKIEQQPGKFEKYNPGKLIAVGAHQVKVEKYLAEGGFAQIYVVKFIDYLNEFENKNKNGTTALQQGDIACLKRVLVQDDAGLEEMRNEVDIMKKLAGGPNIVQYYDSNASRRHDGSDGFEVQLLMELCPNKSLLDYMNQRLSTQLTEQEIVKIMYDTTRAVAYMHYMPEPLIHKDIKVENMLVDANNNFKLCDFGSTSPCYDVVTSHKDIALLTHNIYMHTTPQYRSPEMIDCYRCLPINEKSDIWALGVYLYKLLFFTTPFERTGQFSMLHSKYEFPKNSYSSKLINLVIIMLAENLNLRPNIYQVLYEICSINGTQVPIEDKYGMGSYNFDRYAAFQSKIQNIQMKMFDLQKQKSTKHGQWDPDSDDLLVDLFSQYFEMAPKIPLDASTVSRRVELPDVKFNEYKQQQLHIQPQAPSVVSQQINKSNTQPDQKRFNTNPYLQDGPLRTSRSSHELNNIPSASNFIINTDLHKTQTKSGDSFHAPSEVSSEKRKSILSEYSSNTESSHIFANKDNGYDSFLNENIPDPTTFNTSFQDDIMDTTAHDTSAIANQNHSRYPSLSEFENTYPKDTLNTNLQKVLSASPNFNNEVILNHGNKTRSQKSTSSYSSGNKSISAIDTPANFNPLVDDVAIPDNKTANSEGARPHKSNNPFPKISTSFPNQGDPPSNTLSIAVNKILSPGENKSQTSIPLEKVSGKNENIGNYDPGATTGNNNTFQNKQVPTNPFPQNFQPIPVEKYSNSIVSDVGHPSIPLNAQTPLPYKNPLPSPTPPISKAILIQNPQTTRPQMSNLPQVSQLSVSKVPTTTNPINIPQASGSQNSKNLHQTSHYDDPDATALGRSKLSQYNAVSQNHIPAGNLNIPPNSQANNQSQPNSFSNISSFPNPQQASSYQNNFSSSPSAFNNNNPIFSANIPTTTHKLLPPKGDDQPLNNSYSSPQIREQSATYSIPPRSSNRGSTQSSVPPPPSHLNETQKKKIPPFNDRSNSVPRIPQISDNKWTRAEIHLSTVEMDLDSSDTNISGTMEKFDAFKQDTNTDTDRNGQRDRRLNISNGVLRKNMPNERNERQQHNDLDVMISQIKGIPKKGSKKALDLQYHEINFSSPEMSPNETSSDSAKARNKSVIANARNDFKNLSDLKGKSSFLKGNMPAPNIEGDYISPREYNEPQQNRGNLKDPEGQMYARKNGSTTSISSGSPADVRKTIAKARQSLDLEKIRRELLDNQTTSIATGNNKRKTIFSTVFGNQERR